MGILSFVCFCMLFMSIIFGIIIVSEGYKYKWTKELTISFLINILMIIFFIIGFFIF